MNFLNEITNVQTYKQNSDFTWVSCEERSRREKCLREEMRQEGEDSRRKGTALHLGYVE